MDHSGTDRKVDTVEVDYFRAQEVDRRNWDRRAQEWTGRAVTCRTDWIAASSLRYLRRAARGRQRILEVGCGDGNLLGNLGVAAERVGLDQSDAMLALARERTDSSITYVQGDATRLPFDDGHFDLAYTSRCLINVQDPAQQLRAMGELARVTRPGGTVIMIENFVEGRQTLEDLCRRFHLAPLAPIGTQKPLDLDQALQQLGRSGCRLVRCHHYRLSSCAYYLGLAQIFRRRGLAPAETLLRPLFELLARLDSALSTGRPVYGKDTTLEFIRE